MRRTMTAKTCFACGSRSSFNRHENEISHNIIFYSFLFYSVNQDVLDMLYEPTGNVTRL